MHTCSRRVRCWRVPCRWPQFVPQLARVRRAGTMAGCRGLGRTDECDNAAWLGYVARQASDRACPRDLGELACRDSRVEWHTRQRGMRTAHGAHVGVGRGAGSLPCGIRPRGAGSALSVAFLLSRSRRHCGRVRSRDRWCIPGHLVAESSVNSRLGVFVTTSLTPADVLGPPCVQSHLSCSPAVLGRWVKPCPVTHLVQAPCDLSQVGGSTLRAGLPAGAPDGHRH